MKLKYPIDIHAVGMNPHKDEKEATFAAPKAIEKIYHRDILKDHKPIKIDSDLMDRADLILVMDTKLFDGHKSTFPLNKTHVLKKLFLGVDEDIEDPYRTTGQSDPETLARYDVCAEELKKIISETRKNCSGRWMRSNQLTPRRCPRPLPKSAPPKRPARRRRS